MEAQQQSQNGPIVLPTPPPAGMGFLPVRMFLPRKLFDPLTSHHHHGDSAMGGTLQGVLIMYFNTYSLKIYRPREPSHSFEGPGHEHPLIRS